MRLRGVAVVLSGLLFLGMAAGSRAQTLLKLQGASFAPIRQKAMDADVSFRGSFATATLKLTFFNPAYSRTEADFLYTLPEGAIVTGFAYWYKHERVVARIVEKDRAAQIYKAIKNFKRDPALVEMVGKRTFRARIFPVEQRSDLRVELNLVLVAKDGCFTLPMKMEKGEALESAHVLVRGTADAGVSGVVNSLGQPSTFADGHYRLLIDEKKWRPDKDLRIGFVQQTAGLRASVFAATSSGRDGYFAMTVDSGANVSGPNIVVRGAGVSDVHASAPKSLSQGQTLLVTGRYRGSGPAVVELTGKGYRKSTRVEFGDRAERENLASKLWATDEIESLGKAPRNAARAKAVSLRYTLPSPYTSWLAIPAAERKRFEYEIRSASAMVIGERVADELRAGKSYASCLVELKSRLRGPNMEFYDSARGVVDSAGYDVVDAKTQVVEKGWADRLTGGRSVGARERSERTALQQFAKRFGQPPGYRSFVESAAQGAVTTLRGKVVENKVDRTAAEIEVTRVKGWLELVSPKNINWNSYVSKACGDDERDYELSILGTGEPTEGGLESRRKVEKTVDWLHGDLRWFAGSQIDRQVRDIAKEIAIGELADRGNEPGYVALRDKLHKIERVFPGLYTDSKIKEARVGEATRRYVVEIRDLANLVRKKGIDSPNAAPLVKDVERYRKLAGRTGDLGDEQVWYWEQAGYDMLADVRESLDNGTSVADARKQIEEQKSRLHKAKFEQVVKGFDRILETSTGSEVYGIIWEENRPNPDEASLDQMNRMLSLMSELTGQDGQKLLREQRTAAHKDDSRWAFMQELRKPQPDLDKVNETREKFRDDIPDWRGDEWINWRIERIETDIVLDKLEKEVKTPETEKQIAEQQKKYNELRARMGDPLVQVKLPKGTVRAFGKLPWGQMLELHWNADNALWEARFDVPGYAVEGTYRVPVTAVSQGGLTTDESWSFVVDLTPPTLRTVASWSEGELQIEATGDEDCARAKAVVPWGEPVEFVKLSPGRFVATLSPPAGWKGGDLAVVFLDKAHNRTEAMVHVSARP